MRFSGQILWDQYRLDFSGRTLVMGILNITPDSFSDGGQFISAEAAAEHGMAMIRQGADIVDIGGESTRPGSEPICAAEQIRRVVPVIQAITSQAPKIPISIDTTNAQVAEAAINAGASIINDISALRFDPAMVDLASRRKVPVVLMHMQGTPATMQVNPQYEDVIEDVKTFFRERIRFAIEKGIERNKLILDVGIGFGKRLEDNLRLIKEIDAFYDFGLPVLVGHSRKGFLGTLTGLPVDQRDPATLIVSSYLISRNVHMLRVHDAKSTRLACEIITRL